MVVKAIHHVQLAMPPGREDEARAFYVGVLGFSEVPKPSNLVTRGGLWLTSGDADVHLGVEQDFRPAKKAHPALLVDDLDSIRRLCEASGSMLTIDEPLEGYDRAYVADPFGNRIELLQPLA